MHFLLNCIPFSNFINKYELCTYFKMEHLSDEFEHFAKFKCFAIPFDQIYICNTLEQFSVRGRRKSSAKWFAHYIYVTYNRNIAV